MEYMISLLFGLHITTCMFVRKVTNIENIDNVNQLLSIPAAPLAASTHTQFKILKISSRRKSNAMSFSRENRVHLVCHNVVPTLKQTTALPKFYHFPKLYPLL